MIEPDSRYHHLRTATHTFADGRRVTYLLRRFLPGTRTLPVLTEVTVVDGDRIDLITARVLGDPLQFWRVADANEALNPFELTARPGALLRVAVPQVEI